MISSRIYILHSNIAGGYSLEPMESVNGSQETSLPQFECTKCGACCRNEHLLITVTNRDIFRMAKTLGIDTHGIIRALDFYILEDGEPIPAGLEIIPPIETERGPAYVALKKMENGDCIFLKDDQCMIHPIRPVVCKSFPFVFRESNGELSWGYSSKKEICPGLDSGPIISEEELVSLAQEILDNLSSYRKYASEWNNQSSPRTALGFISRILTADDS